MKGASERRVITNALVGGGRGMPDGEDDAERENFSGRRTPNGVL